MLVSTGLWSVERIMLRTPETIRLLADAKIFWLPGTGVEIEHKVKKKIVCINAGKFPKTQSREPKKYIKRRKKIRGITIEIYQKNPQQQKPGKAHIC